MASILTPAFFLTFVLLSMENCGTITALRCFNCAYRSFMDGETILYKNVEESNINEFYYEDATCIGNNPDPSLSVDCSVPRKLSRAENGYEVLEKMEEKLSRGEGNVPHVCMHIISQERVSTGIKILTHRECWPANWNISRFIKRFDKVFNTTSVGYTCGEDNCNNRKDTDGDKADSASSQGKTVLESMGLISLVVIVQIL